MGVGAVVMGGRCEWRRLKTGGGPWYCGLCEEVCLVDRWDKVACFQDLNAVKICTRVYLLPRPTIIERGGAVPSFICS